MARKKIEIVTCDMCGAEIDLSDDVVRVKSVLSTSYGGVAVHEYNPGYAEEFREYVIAEQFDLCPKCADRAAVIHCEVIPTEGGRSCHHEYSWRDGR